MIKTISIDPSIIDALKASGFKFLRVGYFFTLTPYKLVVDQTYPLPDLNQNQFYELFENITYSLF